MCFSWCMKLKLLFYCFVIINTQPILHYRSSKPKQKKAIKKIENGDKLSLKTMTKFLKSSSDLWWRTCIVLQVVVALFQFYKFWLVEHLVTSLIHVHCCFLVHLITDKQVQERYFTVFHRGSLITARVIHPLTPPLPGAPKRPTPSLPACSLYLPIVPGYEEPEESRKIGTRCVHAHTDWTM